MAMQALPLHLIQTGEHCHSDQAIFAQSYIKYWIIGLLTSHKDIGKPDLGDVLLPNFGVVVS